MEAFWKSRGKLENQYILYIHCIIWPFPPGITLDILALDFWVPGSCARVEAPQYKGKEVFREILEVTEAVSILYVQRVTQDSIFSIAWQW